MTVDPKIDPSDLTGGDLTHHLIDQLAVIGELRIETIGAADWSVIEDCWRELGVKMTSRGCIEGPPL
jgi:hypothetical protein